MQQLLASHEIPSRIVDRGIATYFGAGSPSALEVRSEDRWAALLLLSPVEDDPTEIQDN